MEPTTEAEQSSKNLNTKYQKLAAEYAKLRSQVQVLKKGVVDEQKKQDTLKQTITFQDQSIRKLEQELDSVKFRNRQLEKRIEILQEPAAAQSTVNLLDSNVLIHVEQNKRLQEQLATLNEKYSVEVGRLRRVIEVESVPRELLESMGRENSERVSLLNRKVAELMELNGDLRSRVEGLEEERREGSGKGEDDGRTMEVSELVRRLTESEVGREKLNSEVQILRLKLKRLNSVEAELRSPVQECGGMSSPVIGEDRVSLIGRVEMDEQDSGIVIAHLRGRIDELVRTVQVADSKAVYYYSEAASLCRLVRSGQVTYRRLDGEFGKLKNKFKAVCDELEDVKRGYEGQVDSLTEHIALLNEKVAGVVEENCRLKGK